MKFRFAATLPLALAGCVQPPALPEPTPLTRAAAPDAMLVVPAALIVQHVPRPLTEPADWRRLNDAQAPGGSS